MEPKNYEGIYIVDAEWLANHRKEHYDIEGDEVTFSTLPYVTFEDIYEDAEHINIPLDRLREICNAERDGRCVVLPCNECFSEAGNTVHLIYGGEIVEMIHCGLSICPVSGKPYIALAADDKIFPYREGDAEHDTDPTDWCTNYIDVEASDFGKTVFLTRAEAEAALAQEGGQP